MTKEAYAYPTCLRRADRVCDAFMLDVNDDGKPEVLLFEADGTGRTKNDEGPDSLMLAQDAQGSWSAYARLSVSHTDCKGWRDSLAAGKIGARPSTLADLDVGGERVRLTPVDPGPGCGGGPHPVD